MQRMQYDARSINFLIDMHNTYFYTKTITRIQHILSVVFLYENLLFYFTLN